MGFFNTFSEIANNQDNFRQWEQKKADEDAKREKYFEQNKVSPEKSKEAAELGRVIIDTVDFMDSQSENKSESVEMAFDMSTAIGTEIGTLGTAIAFIIDQRNKNRANRKNRENVSKLMHKLNEDFKKNPDNEIIEDLYKNKLITKSKKDSYFSLKEEVAGFQHIFDKKKFDKLSDKTKKYFSEAINEDTIKIASKTKGFMKKLVLFPALAAFTLGAAGQVIGTIFQVKASKIARYQAREELEDTRNFVQYTDEQKAEAAKYVDKVHVKKEKNSGSIKDIMSLMDDYEDYLEESGRMDEVHLYDIDEKDPQKAYENQKVINKCVTKINNTAEEYSENMETTAGVVLGSSFLGGALFGKISKTIMNKIEEAKNKKIKLDPEAAKDAAQKTLKEQEAENLGKTKLLKAIASGFKEMAKKNPALLGGILAALIATPFATRLQKDASRAGRYQARRELEENPENFIYVDEQQLDKIDAKGEVQNKSPLDVLKSIPKSLKTSFEYEKYKKTVLRERKAMQKALKQVAVTDEQIKDAENLKTRLYKSFDVIDDHSQEYSEKMEAACEISKEVLGFGAIAASLLPMAIISKYPHKILKPTTDIVSGVFKKFNGFATKYTKNLGSHLENTLNKKITRDWEYKQIKFAETDIDEILKTKDRDVFEQKMQSLKEKLNKKFDKDFAPITNLDGSKRDNYQTERYLKMIRKHKGQDFLEISGRDIQYKIYELFPDKKDEKEFANIHYALYKTLNEKNIGKTSLFELNMKEITSLKDDLVKAIDETENVSPELKAKYKELIEKPQLAEYVPEFPKEMGLKEIAKVLKEIKDPKKIKEMLNELTEKTNISLIEAKFDKLSDKDALKIKDNAVTIIENIPDKELTESFKKQYEYMDKNPTKAMIYQDNDLHLSPTEIFLSKDIKNILYGVGGLYIASVLGVTYAIESFLSAKTKEAGRLGTMKAMEALEAENDQFINSKKQPKA